MATNSGDWHEPQGSLSAANKLRVLFLGSEWGSSNGGLSTINRVLAAHAAKHSKVDVSFLVPRCSDRDKLAANAHNIDLREAQRIPGMKELLWLTSPPPDLHFDIVVGHGRMLGPQAQVITTNSGCKWVQFVHTAPEELGMHKEYPNPILRGERKHKTEVELCENANLVVTIGSKLNNLFRSYLSSCKTDEDVFCFTPGIFREFSEIPQVPDRFGKFQVLLTGRGDAEDFKLKGLDTAAEAIALSPNAHLVFVGAPKGKQDEVAERFLERGIPVDSLTVKTFTNQEDLKKICSRVDLAIMPSKTEGFGLTGLEALSAGLPILVSQNSGFAEALKAIPFGSHSVVDSNKAVVWSSAIKKVMGKSRKVRLEESKTLRASYEKKFSWEKQMEELVGKMITLVRSSGVNQFLSGGLCGGGKDEKCIVCACGHPAKRFTVKKETRNKGRQFYSCPNYNSNNGCEFFLWADDSERHASSSFSHTTPQTPSNNINRNRAGFNSGQNLPSPGVRRTVSKDGPNKGRPFYCCAKPREQGCGFVKWGHTPAGASNRFKRHSSATNGGVKKKRKCGRCHQEGHTRRSCTTRT